MRAVLLYHADAELDRVLAIAVAVSLGALAAFTVLLIAVAPREPGRSRRAAGIALRWPALESSRTSRSGSFRGPTAEDEPPVVWWTLFLLVAAAFLLAPVPAFMAYARKEGRLAGAAIGLSLVLPALLVAGLVACGITDACFH